MSFNIEDLVPGTIVNNTELCSIFGCSPQGGMRRAKRTNSLVIVSDEIKLYMDRWEGDVLHYTGMGQQGNQELSYM
ncbi:hypothetical protein [Peribacillus frigoritolerans]|uniref:hypothetical protein n=1 Tax=Peribacillus frigoritolerans TaxID=450367 RepID=UPI0034206C12